ncbi:MAG TPA: TIGR03032 family protein [Allosphingosinicella sp.]|nr:TIGR03032 family protein [Allosphingosinicella sp.]
MMARKKSVEAPAVAVEEAQAAPQAAQPAADQTRISVSRGFGNWLARNRCSLAFTSYQTGQLFLVGRLPGGQVSFHQQNYVRAMGVHATPARLYVGSLFQIWRLENVLAPHERANENFDRLYVPRNAQTTGDIDAHELSVDRAGRVIFVNTKFSCLATTSTTHGFKPLWKPPFISRLAAEDRCHLNGLAMDDGAPAYVTAVSRSDMINGWRDRRHEGGVLIDVRDERIVTDQLSMPHSPRVAADGVYLLDSGRGMLARVDPQSGARTDIAFCPGFLRGLALVGGYAVATVSLPRDGAFSGLALQDELKKRDGEPWCGICIVDLRTGDLVDWIRLNGAIKELFDVAVIPDTLCPMALGVSSPDIQSLISFEPEFGALEAPAP